MANKCGKQITLWDQKKSILFDFRLDDVNRTKMFCKGVKVNAKQIQKPFAFINLYKIDILGGDSGEIVSASRNQLTKIISQILQDNYQILADIYQHLIAKLIDDDNVNTWIKQLEQLAKDIITDGVEKNSPENWKATMDNIILESSKEAGMQNFRFLCYYLVIRLFFHFQHNILLQLFSDIFKKNIDTNEIICNNIERMKIKKLLKYICFSYFSSDSFKNFHVISSIIDNVFKMETNRAFTREVNRAVDRPDDYKFVGDIDIALTNPVNAILFHMMSVRAYVQRAIRASVWASIQEIERAVVTSTINVFDRLSTILFNNTFFREVNSAFFTAFKSGELDIKFVKEVQRILNMNSPSENFSITM